MRCESGLARRGGQGAEKVRAGAVTVNTPWRDPGESQWYEGNALPGILEEGEPRGLRVSEAGPAVQRRDALRLNTAYPLARKLIAGLVVLLLLVDALVWLLVLIGHGAGSWQVILFAIALTVATAGYGAVALVGLALLDVADKQVQA